MEIALKNFSIILCVSPYFSNGSKDSYTFMEGYRESDKKYILY